MTLSPGPSHLQTNFKLVVDKCTKPYEARYCETISAGTLFLLKYFRFECGLCRRLTSDLWVPDCIACHQSLLESPEDRVLPPLPDADDDEESEGWEAVGMCYECCQQIEACLLQKGDELS
jgi:hypothetical protein